ncbi:MULTISPECIES: fatty acid desaturase [unclassified Roseitalea]|uniref:fatty acid desaturase n=1 Tax=unclassified Roseitalea TaxID=2639107 RepID=UPI00273E7EA6|nr:MULTISPECIES: fatty acid desaturase [unclassified Roseitalea]
MTTNQRLEWPTLAMLALCYGLWLAVGLWLFPIAPWLALPLMAVMAGLHTSLQHEALHGHPTRNPAINEALVALPLAVAFPYRRFKAMHLRHHNDAHLTDPYDDPESWYLDRGEHAALSPFMRRLLAVNNTLVGRLVVGPPLMAFGFWRDDLPRLVRGERGVRRAWAHHALGLAGLFAIVWGAMGISPLVYLGVVAYGGMALIAIRTYCEHQWKEAVDGRTVIVEHSRVLSWLFLNNNLHLVHHKLPRAPWYALPRLYRQKRAQWLAANGAYVYRSYWDIFRTHALRAKEPVVHPVLPRAPRAVDHGRAFQPTTVAPSSGPGTHVPVAARPER